MISSVQIQMYMCGCVDRMYIFMLPFLTPLACGWDCKISPNSMIEVDSCPKNPREWKQRSMLIDCPYYHKLNNCSRPESYIYHCLINHFKNLTIEVCAQPAYINSGYCAEYNILGKLIQTNYDAKCQLCPRRYLSSDAFKYQECYNLTKTHGKDSTTERISSTTSTFLLSSSCFTYTSIKPPPSENTETKVDISYFFAIIAGMIIPMTTLALCLLFARKKILCFVQNTDLIKKADYFPKSTAENESKLSRSKPEEQEEMSFLMTETVHTRSEVDIANKTQILRRVNDLRCRYTEYDTKGTHVIPKVRAMIVGCAGAGKSTLLKRLQHRSFKELKQIKSTVELKVYENLFQIHNNCLKGFPEDEDAENKCLLSVVDFAGQCAYYACHQVYLSRRAFYLLVLDLSKPFGQKIDRNQCEMQGSMFSDWTYREYIIFWLKSIHTYCDEDTPVITVATHCDRMPNKDPISVYGDLLELLHDEPGLQKHVDPSRCFLIGFPSNDKKPLEVLSDIEKCIVNMALENRGEETIPIKWAIWEEIFRENKKKGRKVITINDLHKQLLAKRGEEIKDIYDVLRYYHDVGSILYLNEDNLNSNIIIDVQWFVDCYKDLIENPKHLDLVQNEPGWRQFYEIGYISHDVLKSILKESAIEGKYDAVLRYMERFGLLAVGGTGIYLPFLNKLNVDEALKQSISSRKHRTSLLVFRFDFLPYFLYFRLVVACINNQQLTVAEEVGQKCLFKNVACFTFQVHVIVLSMNMTNIQAQIFTNEELNPEVTKEMRSIIETDLKRVTENFHKRILYTTCCFCPEQNIFDENVCSFLQEDEICDRGEFICRIHGMKKTTILCTKERSDEILDI